MRGNAEFEAFVVAICAATPSVFSGLKLLPSLDYIQINSDLISMKYDTTGSQTLSPHVKC
jgi:hypothetical protein